MQHSYRSNPAALSTARLPAPGADTRRLQPWLAAVSEYLLALAQYRQVLPPAALQLGESECLFRAAVSAYAPANAVSVTIGDQRHAICETPFAGIWSQQNACGWLIEAGTVPASLRAQMETLPEMPALLSQQAHTSAARAWLAKLRRAGHAVRRSGGSRIFNLTHESINDSARQEIDAVLGEGAVRISASDWGHGELLSTAWRHVWRGRYRDDRGTLVLETVEVSVIPDLVVPSDADLRRSSTQLRQFAASIV